MITPVFQFPDAIKNRLSITSSFAARGSQYRESFLGRTAILNKLPRIKQSAVRKKSKGKSMALGKQAGIGVFHAFVWLVTFVGILMLWRAAYQREEIPSLRAFAGQLILGWGVFNLVEGIIDHQILGIHYVRQVPEYQVYNLTFLAVGGVLFILIGWLLSLRPSTTNTRPS